MKTLVSCAIATSLALTGWASSAGELQPGDVISAANLATHQADTFEGHVISDLLTDQMQRLIREEGLTITLKSSEPIILGRDYMAATETHRGQARYNSDTRLVEGWVSGMPFPDIDESDPNAAEKLIWNAYYALPTKNSLDYPKFAFLFISAKTGLERVQHWTFKRYYMKGRLGTDTPTEGDGTILSKALLYATFPNDIRGLGTFTIRYDSPKLEDSWAYLKSVRRTRRLSGGAWMDPIGGTDQLNDDLEVFNAHPTWYPEYKLLGKRWVLTVANSTATIWDQKASGSAEFPVVDLDTPPYWNPKDGWEPREVWVIEAITPPEHPYSKKVLYMDTQFPRITQAEAYDRKGQFWKWLTIHLKTVKTADGDNALISAAGATIDYQRRHATMFINPPETAVINSPEYNADSFSIGSLEKASR